MTHAGGREGARRQRHRRLRKRVHGMAERPRLCVFRSHQHLYAQMVDDIASRTLLGWSTKDERLANGVRCGTVDAAKRLGTLIATDAAKQGITKVVFDRGGYLYHGRIRALADAVREGGIQF